MTDAIQELRTQIDAVDDAIAKAVVQRRELVAAIHAEKARRGISLSDSDREAQIEARYRKTAPTLAAENVRSLVSAVLRTSR